MKFTVLLKLGDYTENCLLTMRKQKQKGREVSAYNSVCFRFFHLKHGLKIIKVSYTGSVECLISNFKKKILLHSCRLTVEKWQYVAKDPS